MLSHLGHRKQRPVRCLQTRSSLAGFNWGNIMKKIVLSLLALFCLTQGALADQGRWHTERYERGRPQLHQREFHGGHGYRYNGWGWAPWFSAAAIGTTIYLANQYTPPPTVYMSPPVVNELPRVAYFCQAVQQYYPNTPTCPVPWQVVSY